MLEILGALFYIGVGMVVSAYITEKHFKDDSANMRVFVFTLCVIFGLPFLVGVWILDNFVNGKEEPE